MNTITNNGKQIEVARLEWAHRLGTLATQGYIESCYYAEGVTPQNLASIVGYNFIEKDGLEDLMVKGPLRNVRKIPSKSYSEPLRGTNSTWL